MGQKYSDLLEKTLSGSRLELLHLLAYQASVMQAPLYLVGGVVRDVLLEYPIKEFDLVIEGDSRKFAEYIVKKIGGRVLIHSRFGTATWVLNDSTLKRLNFSALDMKDFSLSFDLVSARSEAYSTPGALPTVTYSTIDDDLHRRDFTINAMAIRLDGDHFGELLDPLDGQKDLEQKTIRILHNRSFIDDPTRMFRAVRYANRYGFSFESETLKLFNAEAKSVLAEISGERLRNEFDLIFNEKDSVKMLGDLKNMDLLKDIHPALLCANHERVGAGKKNIPERLGEMMKIVPESLSYAQTLGWAMYMMDLSAKDIEEVGERLAFPALLTKIILASSTLMSDISAIDGWRPSQWTFYLDRFPSFAVYSVWLATSKQPLRDYLTTWQNVQPFTSGDDLKSKRLEPGPVYKEILTRLRAAWLDGELHTKIEERNLLEKLVSEKRLLL